MDNCPAAFLRKVQARPTQAEADQILGQLVGFNLLRGAARLCNVDLALASADRESQASYQRIIISQHHGDNFCG